MRKPILITLATLLFLGAIAGGVGYWMVYGDNTQPYEGIRTVKIPAGIPFSPLFYLPKKVQRDLIGKR